MNRQPFAPGEWYHCYNRGVDKRTVFEEKQEYERFLQLLYLTNTKEKIHRSDLGNLSLQEILQRERAETLVDIGAFCLMPNHFHLMLKTQEPGGVSTFMQKLMTAYTMYFNIKHKRTGNLFIKPFRSRHVANDRYFQRAVQYIHCNPIELFEPGWKWGKIKNIRTLIQDLNTYPYSSFSVYHGDTNLKPILSDEVFTISQQSKPQKMIEEGAAYYRGLANGKVTP